MNIVQNIINIAKEKKITIAEIERKCNFPKSSIRKWNDSPPSITKIIKISEILNISIDEIITGKSIYTKSEIELIKKYRILDKFSQTIIDGEINKQLQLQNQPQEQDSKKLGWHGRAGAK